MARFVVMNPQRLFSFAQVTLLSSEGPIELSPERLRKSVEYFETNAEAFTITADVKGGQVTKTFPVSVNEVNVIAAMANGETLLLTGKVMGRMNSEIAKLIIGRVPIGGILMVLREGHVGPFRQEYYLVEENVVRRIDPSIAPSTRLADAELEKIARRLSKVLSAEEKLKFIRWLLES